jgi:hypothetical protein
LAQLSAHLFKNRIMATFSIHGSDEPVHQARKHSADILVDDKLISVLPISLQSFSVKQSQHPIKIYAVVHGDSVYVQLHGRDTRIDRVDPTRANAGANLTPTECRVGGANANKILASVSKKLAMFMYTSPELLASPNICLDSNSA